MSDDPINEVVFGPRHARTGLLTDTPELVEADGATTEDYAWLRHVRDQAFDLFLLAPAGRCMSRGESLMQVVIRQKPIETPGSYGRHVEPKHDSDHGGQVVGKKCLSIPHVDQPCGPQRVELAHECLVLPPKFPKVTVMSEVSGLPPFGELPADGVLPVGQGAPAKLDVAALVAPGAYCRERRRHR